jgi:methionyl-tRNA synthetase
MSNNFKELSHKLNCSYDYFIRTTEDQHKQAVCALWKKLEDNGQIYLGSYEGENSSLFCYAFNLLHWSIHTDSRKVLQYMINDHRYVITVLTHAFSDEGWYSIRDEAFYSDSEVVNGLAPTGAPVEWVCLSADLAMLNMCSTTTAIAIG